MKSNLLCVILLFTSPMLVAQTFVEVENTSFDNVMLAAIAFGDVDGDGDQDVIISGMSDPLSRKLKLYINEGGDFTAATNQPFEIVGNGSVVFSDVDGDGDLDVLISGYNYDEEASTKLYTNEGGDFTEVLDTPFINVAESSVAFSDIDGDNDQDLLITGRDSQGISGNQVAKMYLNDGGNFTEMIDTPFEPVEFGSIAFSDVDNDGDPDVLITGRNSALEAIAKLYINDAGVFSEDLNSTMTGVLESSIAFSDIDGDDDLDLLISGASTYIGPAYTKLYENEAGVFTEILDTPFEDVYRCSVSFADVDGDNDPDLLVSGRNNIDELHTKLYINNGGVFTEMMDTPFDGLRWASVAFSDVDGDNDQDVLITGYTSSSSAISKLYRNDGFSSFTSELGKVQLEFDLFPNPSKTGKLNVRYSSMSSEIIVVKIFDISGRLLLQQEEQLGFGNQFFSIDISALNPGCFVVHLDNGYRKGVKEIVVR